MRNSFGKQVLGLLGFTAAGLLVFSGLFYMADHFQTEAVPVARAAERVQPVVPRSGQVIFLPPDTTRRVGKTWLTYRGKIDADHFLIDVTIPELDPETYYHHTLNIKVARKGFRLAGQAYRLVGVHASGIRLKSG